MKKGSVVKVSGPLVTAEGMEDADMFDVVRAGDQGLIGEIIEMRGGRASIQVYEDTAGLGPGAPVVSAGSQLSVELGPGLSGTIYDGIQRPLEVMRDMTGADIARGTDVPALDRSRKWEFVPAVKKGDEVEQGDVIGSVQETSSVQQRIMVPYGVSGTVVEIYSGRFTVEDTVCEVRSADGTVKELTMMQRWPVRRARPYRRKLVSGVPLITGQRVIDTMFPVAKGGVAAVPGPFGSGKTVVQHQLAKWADADIVVYIGCGERGNEMTDVLMEFPELKDPKTGRSLMERTVLIANTSDMPVAAREASIYTGITIAEYFRDMGYSVALMADSTSRWAEALREMSGRLEEMPGEEGYPAYLASRLAQFYERAGMTVSLGREGRKGALTVIGAVSPPSGDISEPVSQATLRIVKVFWCLDSSLAYRRHFPALNWLQSYSLYASRMAGWYDEHVSAGFSKMRAEALLLLQQEAELNEIVQLVGADALSPEDRVRLEAARSVREDYLHQNAFHDVDTYASLNKQYRMMSLILRCYELSMYAVKSGAAFSDVARLPVREHIGRFRYVEESAVDATYERLEGELEDEIRMLTHREEDDDQRI